MTNKEAEELLDALRQSTYARESRIQGIRDYVHEKSLWLSDIGTSEEELKKLLIDAYKDYAHESLCKMREGAPGHIYISEVMHKWLDKGKLSYADIGTSKEELESLRILGCKVLAQHKLAELRKGASNYEKLLEEVANAACDGGHSLSDLGTSRKELEELKVKGIVAIAKDKLYSLRNGQYDNTALKYILEGLDNRRFYIEDIGSTRFEIQELQIRHRKKWRYRLLRKILGLNE